MTLQEAYNKLALLRKRQNQLQKEINQLRSFIAEKGRNPDALNVNLTKRNRAIYRLRKKGLTSTEIGRRYNLSGSRVLGICNRIDAMIRHERGNYKFYLENRR